MLKYVLDNSLLNQRTIPFVVETVTTERNISLSPNNNQDEHEALHFTPESLLAVNSGFGADSIVKKNIPKLRPPLKIIISQWNSRSVSNDDKKNYIRGLECDIIALQEIWQQGEVIKDNLRTLDTVSYTHLRAHET